MTEVEATDNLEDDGWVTSGADYSPKAEFKMAMLAMEAMRLCVNARATEMKQGFWNNRIDKQGNAVRIWQEDQRRKFVNTVCAFENLLSAECIGDDKWKTFKEGIDTKMKELFNNYAYTIFEHEPKTGGWIKTNKKFIPQLEEEVLVAAPNNPRTLVNVKGGWDFKVNAYYDGLVPIYDEIFKELRNVIFRLKDFKKKTTFG